MMNTDETAEVVDNIPRPDNIPQKLIDRIEKFDFKSSREQSVIEALIYQSQGGSAWWGGNAGDGYSHVRNEVPHYLTSMTDTLRLLPKTDHYYHLDSLTNTALVLREEDNPNYDKYYHTFESTALSVEAALCAAILRSLANLLNSIKKVE